jgi:alkanesulfonate monooxygenase SsuD/methylene tetrahydromethanopterin reductase-like flavin-dependent oxidoreductase (luciferase family)
MPRSANPAHPRVIRLSAIRLFHYGFGPPLPCRGSDYTAGPMRGPSGRAARCGDWGDNPVRIGLFYQIQVPKPWTSTSESQRIYEALEQIPFAEEQGFESVWFSEHHFRPVWSHNSAPDLTLAAVSQRTSRIRLGVGVVLAPIHHPLHVAQRMATLDILSRGRVDVGLGRTGYPYQLTPYGTDLADTRGMWQEFADVLPRIWTEEEVAYQGHYYQIPRREVLPKPVQRPHPPLWSACGSDETARQTGALGMGGLFGSEGGPERIKALMALYREALATAPGNGAASAPRAALMTAGFCHEDPQIVASRGTELVGWYIEQQRERARLVWRDYDPSTVPPDYEGYYARDKRLAGGPYPGEPTPAEIRAEGTKFCVGTPAECIRFLERYEALGIEEAILLCAVGPARHEEVLHTLRLFGEEVIPHFQKRGNEARPRQAANAPGEP